MDSATPIYSEKIKHLRSAKAWSQQHLADAAGLSLRTIQRVEANGVASSETRLAIAVTLGVPVGELAPISNAAPQPSAVDDAKASGGLLIFATST